MMAKFGCPLRFIAIVRQYFMMTCRVVFRSEPFQVTNWVKQGCVMAAAPFCMMLSVMPLGAVQDCDTGFPVMKHFNGKSFNLRRLQAKTKLVCYTSSSMLMTWIKTNSEAKMQAAMDQVSQSCDNYGLLNSTK